MKLNRNSIRKLILKEMVNLTKEDALIDPHGEGVTSNTYQKTDYDEECPMCNGQMWEGECMECGHMSSMSPMLNECGCGCPSCGKDSGASGEDYSLNSMNSLPSFLSGMMNGQGTEFQIDFEDGDDYEDEDNNEYMTQKHLHVISDLSQKLVDMIPQGYELEDWQRSHLSSIADDILELYYSLETDFHQK